MQIGAVSSQNFKSNYDYQYDNVIEGEELIQIDLGNEIDKFDKAADIAKRLVESEDMKKPAETAVAIGYAGVKTFTRGAMFGLAVDAMLKEKPSQILEAGLKKGANFAKATAKTLLESNGKKLSNVANFTGKSLESVEAFARNAYKKISKNSSTKGFALLLGSVSFLSFFPALLKKDGNQDGVADIMQKSQNVYNQTNQKLDKLQEKASMISEIAQLLS